MSIFSKIWDEWNRPLSQCGFCNGTGKQKIGSIEFDCQVCGGTGQNPYFSQPKVEPELPSMDCVLCGGTGKQKIGMFETTCSMCNGTGTPVGFSAPEPPKRRPTPNIFGNNICPDCQGAGWVYISPPNDTFFINPQQRNKQTCGKCQGKGTL